MSVRSGQWEIMAQNAVEKCTLQHLLECIVHDLGPQEAAESGIAKGLVGVDKKIMKYGLVQRRAKTAYKKDERFLVAVPGKLLLFKGMDIVGKHVRFVTSLLGASTRLVYGQLEFEVMVPDSKSLNLLTLSAEELTGWIGAIEKSSLIANEGAEESGRQDLQDARADKRRDLAYRNRENPGYMGRRKSGSSAGDTRREFSDVAAQGFYTSRSKGYDGRDQRRGDREYQNREGERDQGNQVYDGYAGGRVELRGFKEGARPDNDWRAPTDDYEFAQTNESKMHLSRQHLDHGRERDQSTSVFNGRQDNRRINAVSNYQELPLPPGTSTQPLLPPQKDCSVQQIVAHSQLNARYLDDQHVGVGSREGQGGYGVNDPSQGHEQRNAGKGVVYYAETGFDRGNADRGNLRESRSWDPNYGPPVQTRSANEERRTSKSSMQSVSVPVPSDQQLLPAYSNSREPPSHWISESRRGSREELEKMAFYMNLYRRGLVDSSTQT